MYIAFVDREDLIPVGGLSLSLLCCGEMCITKVLVSICPCCFLVGAQRCTQEFVEAINKELTFRLPIAREGVFCIENHAWFQTRGSECPTQYRKSVRQTNNENWVKLQQHQVGNTLKEP